MMIHIPVTPDNVCRIARAAMLNPTLHYVRMWDVRKQTGLILFVLEHVLGMTDIAETEPDDDEVIGMGTANPITGEPDQVEP